MIRCGLLGEYLGHSYSSQIHAMMGDYEYRLYEKGPDEVAAFLRSGAWDGLNVTIPYKKAVLPFCDALTEAARLAGSVNTLVRREDGSVWGDNTDLFGFACLLNRCHIRPAGKKTLVLGSGGAGAAVRAVLEEMGAEVVTVSRSGPDHYGNLEKHRDAELLVNATPVGMYPANGASPVDLSLFPRLHAVVDLIYNPAKTTLLLQAEKLGIPFANGLPMLVAQAARSSRRFTQKEISVEVVDAIIRKMTLDMENIVLVGMPGSGKTVLAQALAERTGREVLDSDDLFRQKWQTAPGDYILKKGEAAFRRAESGILAEVGKQSGKIIATGGGCVTYPANFDLLRQNGRVVWVRRALDRLAREGRPLSQGDLQTMQQSREPLYRSIADIVIENDSAIDDVAERILAVLS